MEAFIAYIIGTLWQYVSNIICMIILTNTEEHPMKISAIVLFLSLLFFSGLYTLIKKRIKFRITRYINF